MTTARNLIYLIIWTWGQKNCWQLGIIYFDKHFHKNSICMISLSRKRGEVPPTPNKDPYFTISRFILSLRHHTTILQLKFNKSIAIHCLGNAKCALNQWKISRLACIAKFLKFYIDSYIQKNLYTHTHTHTYIYIYIYI